MTVQSVMMLSVTRKRVWRRRRVRRADYPLPMLGGLVRLECIIVRQRLPDLRNVLHWESHTCSFGLWDMT